MSHLIYGLFDPRNPEVVKYVGYTRYTSEYRLLQHVQEAKQGKRTHRCNWIRSLLAVGIQPVVFTLEEVRPDNWQEREKHWIEVYAATVTNGTAGGEGLVNPSREVRDKISVRVSEGLIGNVRRLGIPHTEESKRAISEGIKNSEQFRNSMQNFRGIDRHSCLTEEQKAIRNLKISTAMTGKKRQAFSDETKRRMSESHKGTKLPSASAKKQGSRFINDGKIVRQLKANEPLPEGWVYGMKLKSEG